DREDRVADLQRLDRYPAMRSGHHRPGGHAFGDRVGVAGLALAAAGPQDEGRGDQEEAGTQRRTRSHRRMVAHPIGLSTTSCDLMPVDATTVRLRVTITSAPHHSAIRHDAGDAADAA